jgi:hypothetical protein
MYRGSLGRITKRPYTGALASRPGHWRNATPAVLKSRAHCPEDPEKISIDTRAFANAVRFGFQSALSFNREERVDSHYADSLSEPEI